MLERLLNQLQVRLPREFETIRSRDRQALVAAAAADAAPEWRRFLARYGHRIAEGGADTLLSLAATEPASSPVRQELDQVGFERLQITTSIGARHVLPERTFRPIPTVVLDCAAVDVEARKAWACGWHTLFEIDLDSGLMRRSSDDNGIDAQRIAVAGGHIVTVDREGVVHGWDPKTLVPRKLATAKVGTPTGILVAGDRLVIAGEDGVVTGELGARLSLRSLDKGESQRGLAFDPSGQRLAMAIAGDVHVVDLASGKRTVLGNPDDDSYRDIDGIVFLPDGRLVMSLHSASEAVVEMWANGARAWRLEHELPGGHSVGADERAVLLPDGKTLVTGGPTEFLSVWDLAAPAFRGCMPIGSHASVDLLGFGDRFLTVEQDALRLWSAEGLVKEPVAGLSLQAALFVPAGVLVISDAGAALYDGGGTLIEQHPTKRPHEDVRASMSSQGVVVSPDGRRIAAWSSDELRILDERGRQQGRWTPPSRRSDDPPMIDDVVFSPDSAFIEIILDNKPNLVRLNASDGKVATAKEDARLRAYSTPLRSGATRALSPDQRYLARGSESGTVIFLEGEKAVAQFKGDDRISQLCFLSNDRAAFFCGSELVIYDIANKAVLAKIDAQVFGTGGIRSLGKGRLVTWNDREVMVWSANLGTHTRLVIDDNVHGAAGDDHRVLVWTTTEIMVFERHAGAHLVETPLSRAAFDAYAIIQRQILERGDAKGEWSVASNGDELIGSFPSPGGTPWTPLCFDGWELPALDLSGLPLPRTSWVRVAAEGIRLDGADLSRCCLAQARLAKADLRGAKLSQVIFEEADLTEADLRGADLTGASFERAKLTNAKLDGAKLDGASFKEAQLGSETAAAIKQLVDAGAKVRGFKPPPPPLTPVAALADAKKLIARCQVTVGLDLEALLIKAEQRLEEARQAAPPGYFETVVAFAGECFADSDFTDKGLTWLRIAADAGLTEAHYALGWELIETYDIPEEKADFVEGLRLLELAAAAGHVRAQFWLGRYKHQGKICPADLPRARSLLESAAGAGQPGACVELGRWLASGELGPTDWPEVIRLYEVAAAEDSDDAMAELALCHLRGQGVPANAKLANEWHKRAKDAGYDWKEDGRWKAARAK